MGSMGSQASASMKRAHSDALMTVSQHVDNAKNFNRKKMADDTRDDLCSYFSQAFNQHPLTIECLAHEVMLNKVHAVEHMVHQGINVNEPIDPSGRTVLDVYMITQVDNLEKMMKLGGSGEQKTQVFLDYEHTAFDMSDLLRDAGAITSSPLTAARGKVPYVR